MAGQKQKRTPGVIASEKRKGSRPKYGNQWKESAAKRTRGVKKCPKCGRAITANNPATVDHDTNRVMCKSCNSTAGINKRWRKAGKK